ncbi:MAG: hypothetical protein F6K22_03435 [Okeania sp. SIO2F4]|uniref:hypothetical protein n=1 Tax=Okeania sp. SIO2F4 TaxID=2607790 RepID=UPI00142A9CF1|nr:hypothetical protein [Okeania sp. SIO2F4]NES01962.1 hypothetical protein [Okeania sp. SIO2F4]
MKVTQKVEGRRRRHKSWNDLEKLAFHKYIWYESKDLLLSPQKEKYPNAKPGKTVPPN